MSKRYFTGKPCPQGHIAERYISSGGCVVCAAERKKAWHKANIPYVLAKNKEWREANPEKYRAMRKAALQRYAEGNQARIKLSKQAWREKNPTYHTMASARWREANPEKALAIVHRRRAARVNNGGSYSLDDLQRIEGQQNGRCYWFCRMVFRLTIEHVVPLSRGGSNSADNIRLACPRCNRKKSNRMPLDFACSLLEGK